MDSSQSMITVIEHEVSWNFPDLLDYSESQESELSSGMIHFSGQQQCFESSMTEMKWSMSSILMSSILRSIKATYTKARCLKLSRSFNKWQAFQPILPSQQLVQGIKKISSIAKSTHNKRLSMYFYSWKLIVYSYEQILAVRKKALSKIEKYSDRVQELKSQKEHLELFAEKFERTDNANLSKKINDLAIHNQELKASVAEKKEFLVAFFSELLVKVNTAHKKESKKNIAIKKAISYRHIKAKIKNQG